MKRLTYAALAGAFVLTPLLCPTLRAEDEGMGPEHHEMGPEKMKEKLGLSDEQAEKFKASFKAMREAAKPLREKMKGTMEKLRDQVKNKASDSEIQATLDELRANEKAMQDAHQKARDDSASYLTPTQRAKMALFMMRRMHEGAGKGPKKREKGRNAWE